MFFHFSTKYFSFFSTMAAAVVLTAGSLFAQSAPAGSTQSIQQQMGNPQMPKPAENVSNQELETFLAVNKKMQSVQVEAQKKMQTLIEEEGLSPKRYDEIARSQMDESSDITPSKQELQKAQSASERMRSVQQQLHTQGAKVIEEEGLTPMRYQQIGMAIQSKPEIQKRYKELIEKDLK